MTSRRVCVAVLTLALAAPVLAQSPPAKKTLYERIGGYDTIAKIIDTFLPKLVEQEAIKPLVSGLAQSSRMRNRQLVVNLLCRDTGGPCLYTGRTMEASHQGIGITEDHWKLSQRVMGETLTELKIPEPERSEFLAVVEKLRADILEKPKPEGKPSGE